jgi:hypothetical protein
MHSHVNEHQTPTLATERRPAQIRHQRCGSAQEGSKGPKNRHFLPPSETAGVIPAAGLQPLGRAASVLDINMHTHTIGEANSRSVDARRVGT